MKVVITLDGEHVRTVQLPIPTDRYIHTAKLLEPCAICERDGGRADMIYVSEYANPGTRAYVCHLACWEKRQAARVSTGA